MVPILVLSAYLFFEKLFSAEVSSVVTTLPMHCDFLVTTSDLNVWCDDKSELLILLSLIPL